jgi:hypothetical protein
MRHCCVQLVTCENENIFYHVGIFERSQYSLKEKTSCSSLTGHLEWCVEVDFIKREAKTNGIYTNYIYYGKLRSLVYPAKRLFIHVMLHIMTF